MEVSDLIFHGDQAHQSFDLLFFVELVTHAEQMIDNFFSVKLVLEIGKCYLLVALAIQHTYFLFFLYDLLLVLLGSCWLFLGFLCFAKELADHSKIYFNCLKVLFFQI